MIVVAACRHEDSHALTGAGEQYTIGILQIQASFFGADAGPAITDKIVICPFAVNIAIVCIPCDNRIVKLQALDIELAYHVLQHVAGTDIILAVQEPIRN